MSEPNDELDLMAGEYSLGTLELDQSRIFERRLANDPDARACLAAWEQRLAWLGTDLEPVEPPSKVWRNVTEIITKAGGHSGGDSDSPARDSASTARRWRGLAMAASVAALALALSLVFVVPGQNSAASKLACASVIHDQATGTNWLVTCDQSKRSLSVDATDNYHVPQGKTLRMWIKPADGGPPRLVGKLPHTRGQYNMNLSSAVRRLLGDGSRLMVSMENNRRSDKNGPSGQVLWVSPIAFRTG